MKNKSTLLICSLLLFTFSLASCPDADDGSNNSIPIKSVSITITAPVTGNAPDIAASGTGNFISGTVTWSPAHNPFRSATEYTATVTLMTNARYTFTGLSSATINGQAATITRNTGDTVTLSYKFPATGSGITNYDIDYSVSQFGGFDGIADTTGLAFVFDEPIDNFDVSEDDINISGAAAKGSATFTGSGTDWILSPIIINDAGITTVLVNKTGIEAGEKHTVVYKEGEIAPVYDISLSVTGTHTFAS